MDINTKDIIYIFCMDPGIKYIGFGLLRFDTKSKSLVLLNSTEQGIDPNNYPLIQLYLDKFFNGVVPDVFVYEKPYFSKETLGRNIATLEIIGIIKYILQLNRLGIVTKEYAPATIKKQVTGYGRAEKSDVIDKVNIIFESSKFYPIQTSHAADAIGAGITYLRDIYNLQP